MSSMPSPQSSAKQFAAHLRTLYPASEIARVAAQPATRRFVRTYRHDRVAFVHDCFEWRAGERPTFYQNDILGGLEQYKRMAAYGPHGLGKTALAAWCVLHAALAWDGDGEDWKCLTTASVWRQLSKFLWPEIHKWARRIKWSVVGREPFDARLELQTLSLKLGNGEAFAVASAKPDLIEGAHATRLFYDFDEAKGVSGATFDAAEGAFSGAGTDTGAEAYALATSTPGEPQGRFYDICSRKPGYEDWHVRHVTLEETIKAGRVSNEWAAARRREWGETSAVFQNRVLGEFAASDEDGIIPLAWIEKANERWYAWEDAGKPGVFRGVGVDVADSGSDQTVFALCYGDAIDTLRCYAKQDTMATTGRVAGILGAQGSYAAVDVIGVGAGVVSRLRELGYDVEAFNASHRSAARDRSGELGFVNRRAEGWWNLREELDPANGAVLALPVDDLLMGDLTAPHWRVVSGGNIQVESKDDIKRRLGRSPDSGDAVVQIRAQRRQEPREEHGEELPGAGQRRW